MEDPVTAENITTKLSKTTKPQELAQNMRVLQMGAVGPRSSRQGRSRSRSPPEEGLLTTRPTDRAHMCGVLTGSAPEKWAQIGPIRAHMGAHFVPWDRGAAGRKNPPEIFWGILIPSTGPAPFAQTMHKYAIALKIGTIQAKSTFSGSDETRNGNGDSWTQ